MIELATTSSFFSRFVRDLEGSAGPTSAILPPDLLPDLRGLDPAYVELARIVWANRIVDEYRSVLVFSELLRLLAEVEAPFGALCCLQRLIGDELRHTQLCAQVARWLGGIDDLAIDLTDLSPPATDDGPAGRALEMVVRELSIAEAESVHVLRAIRDATTDPAIRTVLELLLRDEVRHAAAGRHLEDLLLTTLPEESTRAVRARLPAIRALETAHARAIYAASPPPGPLGA